MEVRLLGPLEVWDEGQALQVRGSKRRAVLALLALHAGEVVRSERLIEELWGARPPANAAAALHNHISRLRKELGPEVVATRPWGYVLRVEPEAIDLRRFEALLAQAKPLPAKERRERLAEALALWRGPPLADLVNEPALELEIPRLEELRLAAVEQRIDADLELGAHEELVPELEALIAAHPLSERLRGQLILALYRSGRQAEALETYRETRRLLVEELGIEPSPELRELERAILCQDPALASAAVPSGAEAPPPERWQWPRSPLAVGVALALLLAAVAGAAVAVLELHGSPEQSFALATPTAPELAPPQAPEPKQVVVVTRYKPVATKPKPNSPKQSTRHAQQPRQRTVATAAVVVHHAAKQHTTTQPVQHTTTKPRAKHKAKAKVLWTYTIADSFEDPWFDVITWHHAGSGTGPTAAEQDGRLELSIPADSVPGDYGVDVQYGTNCVLPGDFDVTVDYQLLTWVKWNGLAMTLGASFVDANKWLAIERLGSQPNGLPDVYTSNLRRGWSPQTDDTQGSLRLSRKAGVLSGYYRFRGRWIRLGYETAPGPVSLAITLNSSGDPKLWGGQAATAAWDNFVATAGSVDCRGFPLPPRKRRT